MKIALDPYMFRALPMTEMVRAVAELGYPHIELSPRPEFMPFFLHPRADDAKIAELRKALRDHDVALSSVLPLYKWSSPDEAERQAAVRYWKRMIEVTVELGCELMNSEFNGRPESTAESEADALGSHIMAEAGYDPIEMAHLFQKLEAAGGSGGLQFLSDHPNPGNRVQAIQAEIRTLPQRQYGYQTGDFQRMKAELASVRAPA